MDTSRGFNRRRFLGMGAAAAGVASAVAGGLLGRQEADASILKPGQFDQGFLAKKAAVRQIWDFTTVDQVQTGVGAMKNAMNSYQFSYAKTHYLLIDLRGPSAVIYALDDAMWVKYNLGAKFQVFDPLTGGFVSKNPLYARHTQDQGKLPPDNANSLFQDASLQALQLRGAHIAACHDALQSQAAQAVKDKRGHGLNADQVFRDMVSHLVPGAQETPSGSSLIAIAQQLGFTYAKQ